MSAVKEENSNGFAIGKRNYLFIASGVLLVVLGFILMSGGGTEDPNKFETDIFSFRRITLAPIVVLSGYVLVGWAILKKFKKVQ
jgi:hypothetical protein